MRASLGMVAVLWPRLPAASPALWLARPCAAWPTSAFRVAKTSGYAFFLFAPRTGLTFAHCLHANICFSFCIWPPHPIPELEHIDLLNCEQEHRAAPRRKQGRRFLARNGHIACRTQTEETSTLGSWLTLRQRWFPVAKYLFLFQPQAAAGSAASPIAPVGFERADLLPPEPISAPGVGAINGAAR